MRGFVLTEIRAKQIRLCFLGILLGASIWAGRHGGGGDFFVLRKSVMAAWSGHFDGVYIRESSGPFFYPPFALVFFGFFNLFSSEPIAIVINVFFHVLSFVGFCWGIRKLFPYLFSSTSFIFWFLSFCFSIAPIHLDFMGQNINLPLAAMLVWVEVLRQRNSKINDFLCGFYSSLIAWIKIFPGFITLTYALRGSRELRWGGIAGGIGGLIFPILVFRDGGFELYREFLRTIVIYHDKNLIDGSAVLNLPGLIARWGLGRVNQSLLNGLIFAIPLVIALAFWAWVFFKASKEENSENLTIWATALGLMTFLNSASRPDYFVFYTPIFVSLLGSWRRLVSMERTLLLLAFAFIALTQQAMVGRYWNIELQFLRVPVIGMGFLFLVQAFLFYRSRKTWIE